VIRSAFVWPAAIALSSGAILGLFLSGFGGPLQLAVALWFLFVCPGMALVRLLHLDQPLAEWMAAVALSIALGGIIASVLVYTQNWSPPMALESLVAIAIVGAVADALSSAFSGSRRPSRRQITLRLMAEQEMSA